MPKKSQINEYSDKISSGVFGLLLCCVGLCKSLLCVGGCKWRVGVVTCQFHGLGKVCSLGCNMLMAIRCSFSAFPCIGCIGILRFV